MSIVGIVIATACVACVGLLIGVFLGFAGIKFKVETDEREEAILGVLPGNNCGGCGYAGCSGLASAIVKGEAPVNGCPVGGAAVGAQVAQIMGQEASESKPMTAYVMCGGNCDRAGADYEYYGEKDCHMKAFVPNGGPKKCNFGCLGDGACVSVCQFDAIHIVNGIAVVDESKCKACGQCVKECPKHLIELIPQESITRVNCSSKDKGPVVMKACEVGCIGCGLCAKNCPSDAIVITDMLAHIDYDKCTGCGICVEKCPKKCIRIYGAGVTKSAKEESV